MVVREIKEKTTSAGPFFPANPGASRRRRFPLVRRAFG
jgi:hypothetical protein